MKGSKFEGATPGRSDGSDQFSNTVLTDGGEDVEDRFDELIDRAADDMEDVAEALRERDFDVADKRLGDAREKTLEARNLRDGLDEDLITDGGLDAETVLGTVDPGDVVVVAESPYRVVDVEADEDDGVLRLYDLVERTETVKAAGAGDVDVYLHRSEGEAIQTRVEQEREERAAGDDQEADVDEGDGVETDGGFEQLNAMERQAEAIEDVAEQMRIQNAALVELTRTLDKLVAVEMTGHPEDGRSGRSVAGWVEDAALDLEERVDLDAVDRAAKGGD